ncbi:hypothetical protein [Rickettsiella endosymbiont of Dermanyssus gallinae]|uniref:hypothetical protein n=1 Tax=Rickettsiella endosymbiont of Dermanyssus gallinae TaxID=2856608 RepID=UPI001C52CBC0|nr:hypothetical protein [Rickettsiella endosymbiont of Dermanyssus gallinae]
MSGSSNPSLVNAAKLISSNFTLRNRQLAGNLADYLKERINERRTIAVGGDASAGISKKTN